MRTAEVAEFPLCIKRHSVLDDMIMDVMSIYMGRHHKGVLALQEPLCKFHADGVGFFCRHFSGFEGLAHLVGNHFTGVLSLGHLVILMAGQGPFRIQRFGVAGMSVL